MAKKSTKTSTRDARRAATVAETALTVGVSTSMVNKVLSGDRHNDTIMSVFMELTEGKNLLLQQVKLLVPFKK